MKKFLLTIVTFVYLMMSSGIAMDVHYCMGKKAGVDFYSDAASKCMKCGMKEKKGCCHDEHKFVKLSNDYKNAVAAVFLVQQAQNIPVWPVFNYDQFFVYTTVKASPANAPPGILTKDICIRNCVFRI